MKIMRVSANEGTPETPVEEVAIIAPQVLHDGKSLSTIE